MIIRDEFNNPLRLSKTRLSEVTPKGCSYWSVDLINLNNAAAKGLAVRIDERGSVPGFYLTVTYWPKYRRIGCRVFDKKNWALIRAAVKTAKETQ